MDIDGVGHLHKWLFMPEIWTMQKSCRIAFPWDGKWKYIYLEYYNIGIKPIQSFFICFCFKQWMTSKCLLSSLIVSGFKEAKKKVKEKVYVLKLIPTEFKWT